MLSGQRPADTGVSMASLAGLFGGGSAPTFVEHEPWERGFAQIFARDVAPGLARLERRRRLLLLVILLIATAALLMTGLIIAKGLGQLATLPGIAALLACGLMASRFKAREERLFLPAVCQQFDSVQVEVAPKGASLSAIDPYWNQGLIPRPEQRSRAVKLNVRELFTGERRGIGLSLVGIEV